MLLRELQPPLNSWRLHSYRHLLPSMIVISVDFSRWDVGQLVIYHVIVGSCNVYIISQEGQFAIYREGYGGAV